MDLVSFDWGCHSARSMKANQYRTNTINRLRVKKKAPEKVPSGRATPDFLYCWVHTSNKDNTKIVKIGISHEAKVDQRIRDCSRSWNVEPSHIVKKNVGDQARGLERKALKIGASPLGMPKLDGYTEMRLVNESQYQQIMEILNA